MFGAWQTWSSGRRRALVSRLGAGPVELARETGPIGGCGEPSLALIVKREKKKFAQVFSSPRLHRTRQRNPTRTNVARHVISTHLSLLYAAASHITAT